MGTDSSVWSGAYKKSTKSLLGYEEKPNVHQNNRENKRQ